MKSTLLRDLSILREDRLEIPGSQGTFVGVHIIVRSTS
jgi:hypothetical protein